MIQPPLRTMLSWLASIACVSLSLCATTPVRAQYYVVQDLGALPGTNSSFGIGINQNSQVIGQSSGHGFLWNNGLMTQVDLPGSSFSNAFGLNDQGDVVGMSEVGGGYHAFLRHATGATTDLHYQLLGALPSSQARDINNQGQIVGAATNFDGFLFGFFYDPATPGAAIRLGTLGGNSSFAYALNKNTELAGTAENGLGNYRAVLYRGSDFAITDLGALSGLTGWSVARDINDSRQVVGWSQAANNSIHVSSGTRRRRPCRTWER
jgi:probable HAF family extracellular repeat protein